MVARYKHGHARDAFKDYEPANVRWASPKTQARNRTTTRLTQEQVDAIRREYVPYKVIARVIADRYSISTSQVLSIVRGEKWQDDSHV
jgi:ribosomal protein S25